MKFFKYKKKNKTNIGICINGDHYDLNKIFSYYTKFNFKKKNISFDELLVNKDKIFIKLEKLINLINKNFNHQNKNKLDKFKLNVNEILWLPPISKPDFYYGIGGNSPFFYRDKNFQIPAYPRGFCRPTNSNALIGHLDTVTIPKQYNTIRSATELGVIIGKEGKNISENKAMKHVFGYTIVNDMCSDSWKKTAFAGKSEDTMLDDLTIFTRRAATSYYSRSTDSFSASGPYIVTKDEIPDPYNLLVWCKLNGKIKERSYSQCMVNSIERVISFLSSFFKLKPGMIIHMGTMGIDGHTISEDMVLKKNDYLECEIEKIGTLKNFVKDLR